MSTERDALLRRSSKIPPRQRRCRWRPTSLAEFEKSESVLLSYFSVPYEHKFIHLGKILQAPKYSRGVERQEEIKISSVIINKDCDGVPLIFLHGAYVGVGWLPFVLNEVAKHRPVYTFDLPGYGRSSRIKFPKNAEEVEKLYIEIIEKWRNSVGLEKFIIAGQSLGGYLAASYALKYPDRVTHLVAMDPWGFPAKPRKIESLLYIENPIIIKVLSTLLTYVNAMAYIRVLGPLGPYIYSMAIKDLHEMTKNLYGPEISQAFKEYCYHCIAKKPSGETAIRNMMDCGVYAKKPMIKRLHLLNPKIKLTMIYPKSTYVPGIPTEQLRQVLNPDCVLEVHNLQDLDHDNMLMCPKLASLFNEIL